MKLHSLLFSIVIACFLVTGCKNDFKKNIKKTNAISVNTQKVSLAISGMTCQIGCAKNIQSKLSKKEGVLDAKVIFNDSIATIEFDANKTSKTDLIAFVDGIAGGDFYKASESTKGVHSCTKNCKELCENKLTKAECKKGCTMKCCSDKKQSSHSSKI